MDSLLRTRVVTGDQATFIRNYPANAERFWVFHNLGPTKIEIIANHKTEPSTNLLEVGDYIEINCISAEVKLAQVGSGHSVLSWAPAS